MARTRMDANRHAELDGPHRAFRLPDLLDRPLHVRRGAGGAIRMPVVDEEQEQGVATELEHVATVPLGDRDQVVEDGRDPLDELLGTRFPVDGKPLRQGREAGDVDRDERAVEDPLAWRVGFLAPGADEPRKVRSERRRRRGGLGHRFSMADSRQVLDNALACAGLSP